MKIQLFILGLLGTIINGIAQPAKTTVEIKKERIDFNDKLVNGRRLTVSSVIPMSIDRAWANVKTPALLQFVAKGMIRFKWREGKIPDEWVAGETYQVKMRIFGFIPFGATHFLLVEKIDNRRKEISTKEWDSSAKVWNHNIKMKAIDEHSIYYEDSILIYGGILTGVITSFARIFYKHRQNRWRIVAADELTFTK